LALHFIYRYADASGAGKDVYEFVSLSNSHRLCFHLSFW
jgi:hypothetical protein